MHRVSQGPGGGVAQAESSLAKLSDGRMDRESCQRAMNEGLCEKVGVRGKPCVGAVIQNSKGEH